MQSLILVSIMQFIKVECGCNEKIVNMILRLSCNQTMHESLEKIYETTAKRPRRGDPCAIFIFLDSIIYNNLELSDQGLLLIRRTSPPCQRSYRAVWSVFRFLFLTLQTGCVVKVAHAVFVDVSHLTCCAHSQKNYQFYLLK